MDIYILIMLLIFGLVYLNFYKLKRIHRRILIKKMKVDDNINDGINEFKRNMNNNAEFKSIKNKIIFVQMVKKILYVILILSMILPLIYVFYEILFGKEMLLLRQLDKIMKIYPFLIYIVIIVLFGITIYSSKNYKKNKEILKKYVYDEFLRKLNYYIKSKILILFRFIW